MNLSDVFLSITKSFLENDNSSFLYFSIPHKFPYAIQEEFSLKSFKIIDLQRDYNPLAPFYSIMKDSNPDYDFIENNAYELHKGALHAFFEGRICPHRLDVVNFSELYYERQMLGNFCNNLLQNFFADKYLILNAQLLSQEAVEFLKKINKNIYKGKIIFCFNNEEFFYMSPPLEDFYHSLENSDNFYEITKYDEIELSENQKNEVIFSRDYKLETFDEIHTVLRNCRKMLSLEQALNVSSWLSDNINNFSFTPEEKRDLLFEIGISNFYSYNFDQALYYLNRIISYQIEDSTENSAYVLLSRVYYEKNMYKESLRCAILVMDRLKDTPSEPLYSVACMMEYTVSQKQDPEHSLEKFHKTLDLLKSNGLTNNYILTSLNIPWVAMTNDNLRLQMMSIVNEVIELAEKIGNLYALSTAYNWKGIILLHNGQRKEAHIYYNKCNEIRTSLGDISSIIKIRNGLSYEYLVSTQFQKAYDLLNDISEKLLEINDNTEIIITLNNIATTLFHARHYDQAYELYKKILQYLVFFHFEQSNVTAFLPEYNDILIHNTFIELIKGHDNRAKINFYNIFHNKKVITKINEPLKFLFQAITALYDDNIDKSYEEFQLAEDSYKNYSSAQTFRHVLMIFEYCLILREHNHTEKFEEYFERAFNLAKEYQLDYFFHDKNTLITLDEYLSKVKEFEPLKLDLSKLDEKIKKDKLITKMHSHLKDARFLNRITALENDIYEDSKFLGNAIHIIMEYCLCDAIIVVIREDENWVCHAKFSKIKNFSVSQKEFKKLFEKYDNCIANCRFVKDQDSGWFYAKSSEHALPAAIILVPSDTVSINQNDINILNIAISNIKSQYVIHRQNERLLRISSTDQLSMLNNRRALQEKLNIESEMISRYNKKREKYFQVSIAFIDLDNFKIINDTFGHETGDLIIFKFSELLRKIYRRVDFISRFGGDEFVILLPNTNCTEAKRAAERLMEALKKANHFIPDMEKHLSSKITIPESNKLSFSMGICSNFDVEDPTDMNTTMTNADRSLYYSKTTGKNRVTIWKDIKKEFEKSQTTEELITISQNKQ